MGSLRYMFAFAIPLLVAAAIPAASASSSVCPTNDRTPIVAKAPEAGNSLVPRGAVSLTVCRYNGLKADPQSVHGVGPHRLVAAGKTGDPHKIAKLTTELDSIRPTRPGARFGCPANFGTELLAFFAYPSRRGDVVTVGLSGCNTITNGRVRRLGLSAPVVSQLAGLAQQSVTGPQWPGEPPPVPVWEPAGA
jgi:hypothetical protein